MEQRRQWGLSLASQMPVLPSGQHCTGTSEKYAYASQRIRTSYCWMPRHHRLQAGPQQTPPGEAAEGHDPAPPKGPEAHLCSVGQTCLTDAMATHCQAETRHVGPKEAAWPPLRALLLTQLWALRKQRRPLHSCPISCVPDSLSPLQSPI